MRFYWSQESVQKQGPFLAAPPPLHTAMRPHPSHNLVKEEKAQIMLPVPVCHTIFNTHNCPQTYSSEGSTTQTYIPFTFLLSSLAFSCWLSRMISKTFSLPPIFFLWYLPCRLVVMCPSTCTKGALPPNLPKGYWN